MKKQFRINQEPYASQAMAFFKSNPEIYSEDGKIEFDYSMFVIIARATGLRTLKRRMVAKRVKEVIHQAIVRGLASEKA